MNNEDRLIQILSSSACLNKRQMTDFLQDKLYPEELYVVQLHLNACPLCSLAVKGFKKNNNLDLLINPPLIPIQKAVVTNPKQQEQIKEKATEAKSKKEKQNNPVTEKVVTPLKEQNKGHNQYDSEEEMAKKKQKSGITKYVIGTALLIGIGYGSYSILGGNFSLLSNNQKDIASNHADSTENKDIDLKDPLELSADERKKDSLLNLKFGTNVNEVLPTKNVTYKAIDSSKQEEVLLKKVDSTTNVATNVNKIKPTTPTVIKKDTSIVLGNKPTKDIKKELDKNKTKDDKKTNPVTSVVKKEEKKTDKKEEAKEPKPKYTYKFEGGNPTEAPKSEKSTKDKPKEKEKEKPTTTNKPDVKKSDYDQGVELYKKGQYASAIMYFNTDKNNKNSKKHNEATYQAALSHKNLKQTTKAKQLFQQLVDNNAPQKAQAQKQLDALK